MEHRSLVVDKVDIDLEVQGSARSAVDQANSDLEVEVKYEYITKRSGSVGFNSDKEICYALELEESDVEEDDISSSFLQEDPGYNSYVSYPKHESYPIPVWKLDDQQLSILHEQYHISRKLTSDETAAELKATLKGCIQTLTNQDGFQFEVPSRDRKYMEYCELVGFPLPKKGKYAKRAFTDRRSHRTAIRTAWTIKKMFDMIRSGYNFTKQYVFYSNTQMYEDQDKSDKTITDICGIVGVKRQCLNVVAAQRGLVLGDILLKLKDGRVIDCSETTFLPMDLTRIEEVLVPNGSGLIRYILVVESLSMLQYLQECDYQNINRCIIVTSCGQGTLQIREFLNILKRKTGLRVYGLCDGDPKGVQIMITYAKGSIETAHDNFHMAVPSLHWVGLTPQDLEQFNVQLPDSSFVEMMDADINELQGFIKDKRFMLSEKWCQIIQSMIHIRKKITFEELYKLGIPYFARELLPNLIDRASKSDG